MGRRRAVEGLVLDLTQISEGTVFTLEEVVVPLKEPREKRVVVGKRRKTRSIIGNQCIDCEKHCDCRYEGPRCFFCHRLRDLSSDMVSFMRDAYNGPCTFCGEHNGKKHYDHVNMFEKHAGVIELVNSPVEAITSEISRCQLVCVPCHRQITAMEVRLGFTKKKALLNRMITRGIDVEELRCSLAKEYADIFEDIYASLARGVGHFA
jgi:hypothetical protein